MKVIEQLLETAETYAQVLTSENIHYAVDKSSFIEIVFGQLVRILMQQYIQRSFKAV